MGTMGKRKTEYSIRKDHDSLLVVSESADGVDGGIF